MLKKEFLLCFLIDIASVAMSTTVNFESPVTLNVMGLTSFTWFSTRWVS